MSKAQTVRGFISQRLSAAAEEIFELFERTIAEYEEQLCRSKEENERQKKLLDVFLNPQLRLHRADVQQLFVSSENVPDEKKDRGLSLDQEDPPEPPHIKDEEEELWSLQETGQLHGLKEEETTEFLLTPVPAQTEEEEGPQSSQLHENQTEEMLDSETQTCYSSIYLGVSSKHESGLNHVSDMGYKTPERFSECATSSGLKRQPQKPTKIPKKEKPLCCSVCNRRFTTKGNLSQHMSIHLSGTPHICPVCGKPFVTQRYLKYHLVRHLGEKPHSCSVCGKSFTSHRNLRIHSFIHSGEKPYGCSLCGKRFVRACKLKKHTAIHSNQNHISGSAAQKINGAI